MLGTDPPHALTPVMASYTCVFSYLLSPQTSPFGGLGSPTIRLVLVGSASPAVTPAFSKDLDSIILSEIVEFAYSLSTPQKGQEPYPGLPHLQPYRLIRAHQLAELGHIQLASRYAGSITKLERGVDLYTDTAMRSAPHSLGLLFALPLHSSNR